METPVVAHPNHGKSWNNEEYKKLQDYLDQKKSTAEIAVLMGRTRGGIHSAIKNRIFFMRKQGMSDVDIAAKVNWSVEAVKNIATKNVEVKDNGKIVNTDRKRNKDRLTAMEAKIDEIHKMLTVLTTPKGFNDN